MNGQKPVYIEISRKSQQLHCQRRQTVTPSLAVWIPQLPRQPWCPGWDGSHGAETEAAYTQVCPQKPSAAKLLLSYSHFHCFSRTDQWKCSSKLVLDHLWAHLAPHFLFFFKGVMLCRLWDIPPMALTKQQDWGPSKSPSGGVTYTAVQCPAGYCCSPGVRSRRFSHRQSSSSFKLSVFTASWPLGLSLIAGFSLLEECVHLFLSLSQTDTVKIQDVPLENSENGSHPLNSHGFWVYVILHHHIYRAEISQQFLFALLQAAHS